MATESSSSEEYLSADEGNEEKSPDKSMRLLEDQLLSVEPRKDGPISDPTPSQLSPDPGPPEETSHHVEAAHNLQSVVLSEEEKAPVPPPRTKRKKRQMNKPPSMENLLIEAEPLPLKQRSRTVCSSDLTFHRALSPPTHTGTGTADSPTEVRKKSDTDIEQESQSSSVETIEVQDHVTRSSRSATPTPAICIEPDALDINLTATILNFDENEIVTSDTAVAKARSSGGDQVVISYSDVDSNNGLDDVSPDNIEAALSSEGATAEGATGNANDSEILESITIKNLDTGEVMPLSAAEDRIPRGNQWNPLSEHLIRRSNEDRRAPSSEDISGDESQHRRRPRIKRTLRKLTKSLAMKMRERQAEESAMPPFDLSRSPEDQLTVKYKQSSHKQGSQEFDRIRLRQDLTGIHLGAVWVMEFSVCGRLLATAGQDSVVRVWVLRTAYLFFHELQAQYQRLGVHSSVDSLSEKASVASSSSKSSEEDDATLLQQPFRETPLCMYYGHTADVLDLTWSKNFFLLSSSMDKTVRLWHISRKECLCCFQHVDFVTAIAFHPRDDRYFLSGSLDGKLRLWNIPDKRVALWNEIEGIGSHLITAANFCMNGKMAVVGTYDGRCIFYETEHLKYHTQIHVRSRHGKNRGRKISGIEPLPGEDKLLVTTNDSRIRLYNLKDHTLSCKYKGCINTSSQIKATFSRDGQYIISGSEDNFVYVWKTHLDFTKLTSVRRDKNEYYECFSTHSAPVTSAVFAPVPGISVDQGINEVGHMIVAADYQGCIKIYVSGEKL
ncbi:WD repeat-containing protein 44-like isoform X2 [Halichondria panicea]|uniref:WD repeat-containing protein 44-like isoform X2 n=1 Tax=Halichondria panicea TaxID=6063 RepID=UPI00312BC66E